MNARILAGLAGFFVLALSPSFVDWQQGSPEQRQQIAIYYAVALTLLYVGVLRD